MPSLQPARLRLGRRLHLVVDRVVSMASSITDPNPVHWLRFLGFSPVHAFSVTMSQLKLIATRFDPFLLRNGHVVRSTKNRSVIAICPLDLCHYGPRRCTQIKFFFDKFIFRRFQLVLPVKSVQTWPSFGENCPVIFYEKS